MSWILPTQKEGTCANDPWKGAERCEKWITELHSLRWCSGWGFDPDPLLAAWRWVSVMRWHASSLSSSCTWVRENDSLLRQDWRGERIFWTFSWQHGRAAPLSTDSRQSQLCRGPTECAQSPEDMDPIETGLWRSLRVRENMHSVVSCVGKKCQFLQDKKAKLTARWCSCRACPCDGPLLATWRALQLECQGRVNPPGWRSPTSAPQMTSWWRRGHMYINYVVTRVTVGKVRFICPFLSIDYGFEKFQQCNISGVNAHFLPSSDLSCTAAASATLALLSIKAFVPP